MRNRKVKIAYLLTTFIFLFTYIGGLLGSIESYAYAMQNSEDTALVSLLEMMMKYGDSAYAYIH